MIALEDLEETFRVSEAALFEGRPFQLTGSGIWLATPFPVLISLMQALDASGFWDRLDVGSAVMDAGMGDGRLVAALACTQPALQAYGMESHEELHVVAEENLTALTAKGLSSTWRVARGDYLDPDAYGALGLTVADLDLILNYADGSEEALANLLTTHGKAGVRLAILTMDLSLEVSMPIEEELRVEPGYRLILYRKD